MVELNFVRKDEIDSFNEGANARFSIIFERIFSAIDSQPKLEMAESLYDNSVDHIKIANLCSTLERNATEYNKAEISDVIEEIISIDPQIYYDLIVVVHAMLQAKNVALKKDFMDKINAIASQDDMNTTDESDEEVDVPDQDPVTEAVEEVVEEE